MVPTALLTTVHRERTQTWQSRYNQNTEPALISPELPSTHVPEEHDLPVCLGSVAPQVGQELQE